MGEVMPGFKCVCPKGSEKWVTLWELNKMRRNEPEKISSLWYDQFDVDCTVFNRMAGPPGMALCYLLDHHWAVRGLLLTAIVLGATILNDPIHFIVVRFLSSAPFWRQVCLTACLPACLPDNDSPHFQWFRLHHSFY
jgi:hypothetical protein